MATNLGGKARPRSLVVQRRQEDERQLALEVQRAQAEERRQRLEEQKHELEVKSLALEERKHELEKDKLVVDVAKHFTTVITALLFILAYFSDEIITYWRSNSMKWGPFSMWDVAVAALTASFTWSLVVVITPVSFPSNERRRRLVRVLLVVCILLMALASAVVITGMLPLGRTP